MSNSLIMYSVPMVSTWTFLESARLLVDCGDGAAAMLGGKIQKVDTIAITHAHRDHIGGLMQLLNLRGGSGRLRVVHPAGSGSFPALRDFLSRFDEESSGRVEWIALSPGDRFQLTASSWLEGFPTNHMTVPGRSIGYRLIPAREKLKEEFLGRDAAIPELIKELGRERMFRTETVCEYAFGGDGLPTNPEDIQGAQTLILECTFMESAPPMRDHLHASLPEVHDLVRRVLPSRLILNHISLRYSHEDVQARVGALDWPCPVQIALPGPVHTL